MKQIFKIGDKVKKIVPEGQKTNYLQNGIVIGISGERLFIKWPQHGSSSIPANTITFQ